MVDKIEHIFYINLEKRKDRNAEIINELTKMDLINKTERFNAITNSRPYLGCCYSHLACLKMAKERKYKNILIFEDDFEFLVSKDYFYKKMEILMNEEWDMLFLSYNSLENKKIDENKIQFIHNQTASGYIIREHYYDKLIAVFEIAFDKLEQTGQHWLYMNDQCWMELIKKDTWYGIIDRIGKQRAGFSDLANKFYDYGC